MEIIDKFRSFNYELVLPYPYEQRLDEKWPLIVFLHGSGRRGDDISMIDVYGLNGLAKSRDNFEFMLITPQCPADKSWVDYKEDIIDLVADLTHRYSVDSSRVYLTGFSLGGNGTWEIAAHSPTTFAAIAPIAGWCDLDQAVHLIDMPIWNFHGEEDDVVSIQRSEAIINELLELGHNVKFTRYPGAKHGVMNETYANADLFEWLLQHRTKNEQN